MARGVVPVRVKPTGDMTDDFLTKMAQTAEGKRSSSKTTGPDAGVGSGVGGVGGSAHVAGRLRPASAPAIRASAAAAAGMYV